MTYLELQEEARKRHLVILGGFHPEPGDKAPEGCKTLLMLGPDEPRFWPAFQASVEARDDAADPLDRWSHRVIGDWATALSATAIFPFGGPPYKPFFSWAVRTGRVHASPIRLLVHDVAGLFVSFRGALALAEHVDLPENPPSPCSRCENKPCKTACPVAALDGTGYDVPGCKSYLSTPTGALDCMASGCAARRACPVSKTFGRMPEQSAFHMRSFYSQ